MAPLNSQLTELDKWLEKIISFQQENTALKLRLSELVDGSIYTDFLQKAESLNNELLANDESLQLITDSARNLEELLHQSPENNNASIIQKKTDLKKDIDAFTKRFSQLKRRFLTDLFSVS
ncbi:MAG: hypothetical protein M9898_14810 [Chitinophagaceae bacterium]|nr:hypothetical protein [Chitinophagaceae bacterium]